MKKQYLLTDDNKNGVVTIESSGMVVTFNHPKHNIFDISKETEVVRQEIRKDPGKFMMENGKLTKRQKPLANK